VAVTSGDLSDAALAAALPGRPVRSYPALLSTEADARAWARAGAPAGAVVVADYQAAARGRGGLPWTSRPGRDLGFTLILRPAITPDEEGWLYVAAGLAVLDVVRGDAVIEWPDRIHRAGEDLAHVAAHAGLGAGGVAWAIVNVLMVDAGPPRGPLLARLVAGLEALQQPSAHELARFQERCATLGRPVVAHIVPTWPDGVQLAGTAVGVKEDGALVLEEPASGRRIAVRPQHLARLEAGGAPGPPG
jgi:BirA family biotin operon repressor/biotin-[acetyl-CoA-carboxylase] ligase